MAGRGALRFVKYVSTGGGVVSYHAADNSFPTGRSITP